MKKLILIITTFLIMITGYSQTFKDVNSAKGLNIGSDAPLFSAISDDSTLFVLADALEKGPVVVIFYR